MKIGSTHEGWISLRPQIKPYLRWGCMWPCLELNKDIYMPCYRWHGHAKIEHGRATNKLQHNDVSCAAMLALFDSPRKDNFQLKFR